MPDISKQTSRSFEARRAEYWPHFSAGVCLLLSLWSACTRQPPTATSSPASVIGSVGTGPGQFIEPRAIAASYDGKIFVIDKTSRVQRFSAKGEIEHWWPMPGENRKRGAPSGICVDQGGRVLVADTHESQMVIFDQEGSELLRFGTQGMGSGQFMLPTDVAVDRQGFIYVSEYGGNDRISKFTPEGEYLSSFGDQGAGSGTLQHPSGIAIDERDFIWVADANNHRVCRYRLDGALVSSFGSIGRGEGQLRYPRDVVCLGNDCLAVVDQANDRVQVFDYSGHYVRSWGHPGRDADGLHQPESIAWTHKHFLIADSKNHRVVEVLGKENDGRVDPPGDGLAYRTDSGG